MSTPLGHTFVSGKPNVADLTEIQGGRDWDGVGYTSGSHAFAGGNVGAVLVRTANDADGSGGGGWVQSVATGSVFLSGGVAALPTWGKVDLTAHVTNTLPAANGGTGLAAYAVGDLLYASAVTPTLSRLAAVASGQVLVSAGVNTPPAWSASPTLTSLTTASLVIGASPASQGSIRLVQGGSVYGHNNAGLADGRLFDWGGNAVDVLTIGDASYLTQMLGSRVTFGGLSSSFPALKRNAAAFDFRLADDSDYCIITVKDFVATRKCSVGPVVVSSTGDYNIGDGRLFARRNHANSADIVVFVSSSVTNDDLTVGDASGILRLAGSDIQWGKALVALGGGATATLGTIGVSGPATAAQNTWMRVLDSSGAAFFVPAFK